MQLVIPNDWISALRQDDDLLVGNLSLPFLTQTEPVEVCFIGQESGVTEEQIATLSGYLAKADTIHQEALLRIFADYKISQESYRQAFREWGEDPDENAPRITRPEELATLLLYQTLFIPARTEVGTFGMGFWAKWEREHGIGLRYLEWKLSEAGENAIHFSFEYKN